MYPTRPPLQPEKKISADVRRAAIRDVPRKHVNATARVQLRSLSRRDPNPQVAVVTGSRTRLRRIDIHGWVEGQVRSHRRRHGDTEECVTRVEVVADARTDVGALRTRGVERTGQ